MRFYGQYDQHLSDRELAFVSVARSFCEGPFADDAHRAFRQGEALPSEWYLKWAETGFLGLQTPVECGGLEASFMCKIRVAQEMARRSFAAAFCLNHHQGSVTRLSRTGTQQQRDELLSPMLAGNVLATTAMTEPQGGSDLAAMQTVARSVAGGWLINGTKSWITNGLLVNCLFLLARDEAETAQDAFGSYIVRLGPESTYTRTEIPVTGARTFRFAQIEFSDHFVPENALFAKPGQAFKASLKSINAARVHVAAMCIASLESALHEALDYCDRRKAFGKTLMEHQGLRWELADVATRLEAASALVCRAAVAVDKDTLSRTLAAQCKAFAVDTAILGIDKCIRAMGAVGASDTHRLAMLQSEIRMAGYGDGTNQILLDRIGRDLGKTYGSSIPQA